jgi:hypothetical protein
MLIPPENGRSVLKEFNAQSPMEISSHQRRRGNNVRQGHCNWIEGWCPPTDIWMEADDNDFSYILFVCFQA